MLYNLKGELIKKRLEPNLAIMNALKCSEKTARNKLKGITPFTVPEAIIIEHEYFQDEEFNMRWLFENQKNSA